MLPWPFQGEQQLASPESWIMGLSSEFIQCIEANSPDVSFIWVGTAMSEAKGSPRSAPECAAPVTRLSEPLSDMALSSRQFSNFLLSHSSYWQAPWVSHEVFFGVRERKGTAAVTFPLPKCQLHLTLYLCLLVLSPPSWAQRWPSHTLDRGHFPEKYNSTFKITLNAEQQPKVASFPTALTTWVQRP